MDSGGRSEDEYWLHFRQIRTHHLVNAIKHFNDIGQIRVISGKVRRSDGSDAEAEQNDAVIDPMFFGPQKSAVRAGNTPRKPP